MKSRDTLIRLKRFQAEEKRRRVAQIEAMIAEFARMASDLDRDIALEEQRSGVTDTGHFAYSTYARAARVRRDNLNQSIDDLHPQLEEAKTRHAEALEEFAKAQSMESREKADRVEAGRERSDLDASAAGASRL